MNDDYKADLDRFLDERQSDEDFAKADKREREHEAELLIDKAYKGLSKLFPVDQVVELIPTCNFFEELGFTIEEARGLVISHLNDKRDE